MLVSSLLQTGRQHRVLSARCRAPQQLHLLAPGTGYLNDKPKEGRERLRAAAVTVPQHPRGISSPQALNCLTQSTGSNSAAVSPSLPRPGPLDSGLQLLSHGAAKDTALPRPRAAPQRLLPGASPARHCSPQRRHRHAAARPCGGAAAARPCGAAAL